MEEDLKNNGSGNTGSGDATGSGDKPSGNQDSDASKAAKNPQDAAPVTPENKPNNTTGESTGTQTSSETDKGRERALGDKEPEKQKTPDELRAEQVAEAIKSTIARFQLTNSTVIANIEKEFSTPGVKLTDAFMEKQVMNIDPVNFAMTKFRELTGGSMQNISNVQIAQLSPQSVGTQQGRSAGLNPVS